MCKDEVSGIFSTYLKVSLAIVFHSSEVRNQSKIFCVVKSALELMDILCADM